MLMKATFPVRLLLATSRRPLKATLQARQLASVSKETGPSTIGKLPDLPATGSGLMDCAINTGEAHAADGVPLAICAFLSPLHSTPAFLLLLPTLCASHTNPTIKLALVPASA